MAKVSVVLILSAFVCYAVAQNQNPFAPNGGSNQPNNAQPQNPPQQQPKNDEPVPTTETVSSTPVASHSTPEQPHQDNIPVVAPAPNKTSTGNKPVPGKLAGKNGATSFAVASSVLLVIAAPIFV